MVFKGEVQQRGGDSKKYAVGAPIKLKTTRKVMVLEKIIMLLLLYYIRTKKMFIEGSS